MDIDKLYEMIRKGDPEGKEVLENMYKELLRGAAVSITSRNFSHSLGSNIKKYQTED